MNRLLAFLLGSLLCASTQAADELSLAHDLRADAAAARAQCTPIVVFFASDFCPYCHEVEELYLEPLQRRNPRVLIRKVHIDRGLAIVDFSGTRTVHTDFSRRAGASFTPFIRFYGPDGQELTTALRGFSSRDFFGALLASAVEDSIARICGAAQGRASAAGGGTP
jgi:thiol:disulfide interchange protein